MYPRILALIGVCLLAIGVGRALGTTYSVTDLGALGTGPSSALAINDSGQVVGYSLLTTDQNSESRAFLYATGTMTDLGYSYSRATGINNSGTIVGSLYADPSGGSNFQPYAFSCTTAQRNAGTVSVLSWGGVQCEALAVNDSGNFAGYTYKSSDNARYGFFSDGTTSNILTFVSSPANSGTYTSANAINSNNVIVGGYNLSGGAPIRAFVYDGSNGYDVGTLGGTTSEAFGVNANLQIVGQSKITGDAAAHGFLYDGTNGTTTDVGTLGGDNSTALGINTLGHVVGNAEIAAGNSTAHAYLYRDGTITDLNTLIPVSSGWTLLSANAINASDWIVGMGTNLAGQEHAFLLKPGSTLLPGDANGDGVVDVVDLSIELTHYDHGPVVGDPPLSWPDGDFTGDHNVTIDDLVILLTHYDKTATAGPSAVPEPSSVALLVTLAGAIGSAFGWRKRA